MDPIILGAAGLSIGTLLLIGALWAQRTAEQRHQNARAGEVELFNDVHTALVRLPAHYLSAEMVTATLGLMMEQADRIARTTGLMEDFQRTYMVESLIAADKANYLQFLRKPIPVAQRISRNTVLNCHRLIGRVEQMIRHNPGELLAPEAQQRFQAELVQARWRVMADFDRLRDGKQDRVPRPVPEALPRLTAAG